MANDRDSSFLQAAVDRGLISPDIARDVGGRSSATATATDILLREGHLTQPIADMLMGEIGPAPAEEPTIVAGFKITGRLGKGGMGTVYRALQVSMQREVALKVIAPQFAIDKAFCERFIREARTAGSVNHPNVITCYDVGQDRGHLYMALELVTGGDAAQLAKRRGGRLPEGVALKLIADCSRGLMALRRAGLIHRDIKPANIFITEDGIAKLADLGLARSSSGEDRMTMTGSAMGTPAFMSPEQASGDSQLDHRTDIYALGATLFALLTGDTPFRGASAWAVVAQVIKDPVPDPRGVYPGITDATAAVVLKAMSKDRDQRHPTPEALIEDLELVLAGKLPRHAPLVPAKDITRATLPPTVLQARDQMATLATPLVALRDATAAEIGSAHDTPVPPITPGSPLRVARRADPHAATLAPTTAATIVAPPAPIRPWMLPVTALALVLAGGGVVFGVMSRGNNPAGIQPASPQPPVQPTMVAPTPAPPAAAPIVVAPVAPAVTPKPTTPLPDAPAPAPAPIAKPAPVVPTPAVVKPPGEPPAPGAVKPSPAPIPPPAVPPPAIADPLPAPVALVPVVSAVAPLSAPVADPSSPAPAPATPAPIVAVPPATPAPPAVPMPTPVPAPSAPAPAATPVVVAPTPAKPDPIPPPAVAEPTPPKPVTAPVPVPVAPSAPAAPAEPQPTEAQITSASQWQQFLAEKKFPCNIQAQANGNFIITRVAPTVTDLMLLKGLKVEVLDLSGCERLGGDLRALAGMPLKSLNLQGCRSLGKLRGLDGIRIEKLNLAGCADLGGDLLPLTGAPLTHLDLSGCERLASLKGLQGMPLTELNLSRCRTLAGDLSQLRGMPLNKLSLGGCAGLERLDGIQGMPFSELDLRNCANLRDISVLASMPLKHLYLSGCEALASLNGVQGMALGELDCSGCRHLDKDLEPLRGLTLTRLILSDCSRLKSLDGIETLPLIELDLSRCAALTGITPLHDLRLTRLSLAGCEALTSLIGLQNVPLQELDLSNCISLAGDLGALRGVPLISLDLTGCSRLTSLDGLQAAPLKRLVLTKAKGIKDRTPVMGIQGLEIVP